MRRPPLMPSPILPPSSYSTFSTFSASFLSFLLDAHDYVYALSSFLLWLLCTTQNRCAAVVDTSTTSNNLITSVYNLSVNTVSLSDTTPKGRPCNRQISLTNALARVGAVLLLGGTRCAIFENLSTITHIWS